MANRKSVILVLVEGFSDKSALENIIKVLVPKEKIIFSVMNGDITSNRTTKADNILRRVGEQTKECMSRHKIIKSDVSQIIHLVDADGVFIPDSHIKQVEGEHFQYGENEILAKNQQIVKDRNAHKSAMLKKLEHAGKLFGVPYRVYYMSCNLDHVLYNIRNLEPQQKVEYADLFYEKYEGREKEFLSFINDREIAPQGDYKDTWRFIEEDVNSLNRFSNLHLFFDDRG